jgi:fructose-bisphosphate aldolase class I
MTTDLEATAQTLISPGKGILATDQTVAAVTRRLDAMQIESTADTRRRYRELFFTTPGIAQFISGVILHDDTIHQRDDDGIPLVELLARRGILPGITVDAGPAALAGSTGEHITEGLDGLRDRLEEYRSLGARFAKWRAVFEVSESLPTGPCIHANAHALARFAAMCQERSILPIVHSEVLMDGSHTIERCEDVTGRVLHAVFRELAMQRVALEAMLLEPNMVLSGEGCVRQPSVREVALATLRCLRRQVPAAVPGIAFLSGGQHYLRATLNLSGINQVPGPKPWTLTFCYGRALQDEALAVWRGRNDSVKAAQDAFYHRARCAGAAALGTYTSAMEIGSAVA